VPTAPSVGGCAAGEPGRPRRQRPAWRRAWLTAGPGSGGAVRHHRIDPRGVGSSTPTLHCDPSFFDGARPDYIPASKAAERVLTGRAKAYAADCERKYGWLLPHLTTQDTARDIDSIRAALGTAQISYFGYSYGTYIGQVYATMFPSRVRRMVLDSTVDPTGVWYADNIAQDYAFLESTILPDSTFRKTSA
jgi:pimeloyl-ACP methyl ester carboxylesterase